MTDRRERLERARLYLVAPAVGEDVLRAAVRGGAGILQLRDRSLPDDDALLAAARTFRRVADDTGALFVVNDRPDLALAARADGVHVGQDDLAPGAVRDRVGSDLLIGLSTHDPEQGARAQTDPDVDQISVGPVYETPTKPGRPAAGEGYVRWAAGHLTKPWFAIGGIDATTLPAVVAAGARRIVVVRAITGARDPEAAARALVAPLTAEVPSGVA